MASHPCTWSIQDGVLQFENIISRTHVIRRVLVQFTGPPVPGLMLGDEVHNVANIYFDFNEPAITEPVLVVTSARGGGQSGSSSDHPNPVRDRLMLHGAFGAWLQVDVLDGLGRRVTGLVGDVRSGLDVSTWPRGWPLTSGHHQGWAQDGGNVHSGVTGESRDCLSRCRVKPGMTTVKGGGLLRWAASSLLGR